MLRSIRKILGYTTQALDGDIGVCRDFLFDDREWTIRYLVVKTEKWLPGQKVLVSPRYITESSWAHRTVKINCKRVAIESSPRLDMHAPVSHEFETAFYDHYTTPYYWTGAELWGDTPDAYVRTEGKNIRKSIAINHNPPFSRTYGLQLISEVSGYHVNARDRMIGHVEDFIMEELSWNIRFLVIRIRNWLPTPKVILNIKWFKTVDWNHKNITTRLKADQIRKSQRYNPREPINKNFDSSLYDYYGRPVK